MALIDLLLRELSSKLPNLKYHQHHTNTSIQLKFLLRLEWDDKGNAWIWFTNQLWNGFNNCVEFLQTIFSVITTGNSCDRQFLYKCWHKFMANLTNLIENWIFIIITLHNLFYSTVSMLLNKNTIFEIEMKNLLFAKYISNYLFSVCIQLSIKLKLFIQISYFLLLSGLTFLKKFQKNSTFMTDFVFIFIKRNYDNLN